MTGAQLRVRLIDGKSWVSVSDSTGKTIFEGILSSGEFRDFSDPTRLKILVGNALAVNLNCDGHDSGPAGGSGMVAKFACTPDGLTVSVGSRRVPHLDSCACPAACPSSPWAARATRSTPRSWPAGSTPPAGS